MNNPIRLLVIEPNNGGGLVHFAYQMCAALAAQGLQVTMLTGTEYELAGLPHAFRVETVLPLWRGYDPPSLRAERRGWLWRAVYTAYREARRVARGARLIWAWIKAVRYITRLQPDIVQFTRLEHAVESFFIAWLRRRGFTLTQLCHEFEHREKKGWFESVYDRVMGNVYRHFSAIFFLSEQIRLRFLTLHPDIPPERAHVIPHGNSDWLLQLPSAPVDSVRQRLGLKEGERVVLFFGLLAPSKGLEDLFEAFALTRRKTAARLVVAGYPTKYVNMGDYLERVRQLGIEANVVFDARYIPLDEIRPLMELASVVVYPYRSGTQSGALQTAYTFGKPVIATTVGGLPEAVEDGKNGFLVPPRSPYALAEKIIALLENPALAEEMGRYSRHLADTRFSWRTVAAKMRPVFEGLAKGG